MKKEPLISVDNVSFAYHGNQVLTDIDLEIYAGDYVGIIGPNGSGKTTLLRLMLGLLTPDQGEIKLFGQPLSQVKDWTKIGYIPQKATHLENQFPITVAEVVSLGRIAKKGLVGMLTRHDKAIIRRALEQVGLGNVHNRLLTDLSGGQQQRVFIAKALASEPDILILDEPTVGIDTKSEETFYALLEHLHQQESKTIVVVSHDIDVITGEVTTLACLNRTLVYHGPPQSFNKETHLEKLYGKGKHFVVHAHE